MWNIYWLFDWVDIADTKYEIGRDELFSTLYFRFNLMKDTLTVIFTWRCWNDRTDDNLVTGFFSHNKKRHLNDSFDEYIWAGSDWSWSCFENQRENEDDAKLYVVGSVLQYNMKTPLELKLKILSG